jgi:hypothetical protein
MNERERFGLERRVMTAEPWVKWLLSAGAWTLAALIFASLEYFTAVTVNQPRSYWNTLFWNTVALYIFAALFPIILYAARRFPIEKRRRVRAVMIHAALNLLLSVAVPGGQNLSLLFSNARRHS